MSTLLIFLLLILSFLLSLTPCRKSYIFSSLATILIFIIIGCGFFPLLTLKYLESQDYSLTAPPWAKTNAIIILGAGTVITPTINSIKPTVLAYSRINEAASRYFSCKKSGNRCTLIISGGDASKTGQPEAVVYQNELSNLGVPPSDMLLEQKSLNTYQNAEFTHDILKSKSFEKIYLVTSGIHIHRALLYFKYFDIHAIPIAADYITPALSVIPIGYNFAISDLIFHELIGTIQLYVYHYLGWNNPTKNSP